MVNTGIRTSPRTNFIPVLAGSAPEFIIKVDTTNAGDSAADSVVIPVLGTYDVLDWGDGNSDLAVTGTASHTYAVAGIYTITLSDTFTGILYNNASANDKEKIIEIMQWGTAEWSDLVSGFRGCNQMEHTAEDSPNFSAITNMFTTFSNCSKMTNYPAMDTSNVTNFEFAWSANFDLADFPLIDVSSATSLNTTWQSCLDLVSFPAVDVSHILSFGNTWQNCTSLINFGPDNFNSMTNGSNTLKDVTLPTAKYSDLLVKLEADNPNDTITFHGGNSKYDASGGTARTTLVASPRLWTITDGGPA